MHIYALVQNLVCLIPTLSANMSQLVKDRFKRLLDTAIFITGTNKIVPAVVFHKLGRLSAYVEHYYLHTERLMILVVEPITDPRHRYYISQWREELLENILLKLASTGLVAGNYYTYVHSFMARYFFDANLLRKLAFALEEGLTFDEEDPDLNTEMHYLFYNTAYGQKWKAYSLLHISKVLNIKLQGKQFTLFYSKFKNAITFY